MSSGNYYIVDASKWQVLSVLDENGVLVPFPYQSYEEARASMENIVMVDEEAFQVVRMDIDPSRYEIASNEPSRLVRFDAYGGGKGRAAFNTHEISSVIENTTRGTIEIRTSNVTYAVKETDFEAVVRKIAVAMNPASDRIEVLELQKELAAKDIEIEEQCKEMRGLEAELAAERAKPKGGVAWALKSPTGSLVTNFGDVILFVSSVAALRYVSGTCSAVPVPYPLGDAADELKAAIDAKEKAESELSAERAKPTGGVAWGLRNKRTGKLDHWLGGETGPALLTTEANARKRAEHHGGDCWEPVPYPLGPAADELKAAIERAEKAEAEVKSWKAAANSTGNPTLHSPADLAQVLGSLIANASAANDELAVLKATPATEPPPLDKWRVLATAERVVDQLYRDAETLSIDEVAFKVASGLLLGILGEYSDGDANPYPLKD